MSYAPNGSLRKRFPRGTRVELAQVITIVGQIAAALDYAHQQKLIHRDVKPQNMLAGQHDQVLLSDFGLVLVAQSASSTTIPLPPVHAPAQPSRRPGAPWRAALLLVALLVVIAGGLGAWYGLTHLSGSDLKQPVLPGTVRQNPSTAVTGNAPATASANITATVGQGTPNIMALSPLRRVPLPGSCR